jgi:hypothetical protein
MVDGSKTLWLGVPLSPQDQHEHAHRCPAKCNGDADSAVHDALNLDERRNWTRMPGAQPLDAGLGTESHTEETA